MLAKKLKACVLTLASCLKFNYCFLFNRNPYIPYTIPIRLFLPPLPPTSPPSPPNIIIVSYQMQIYKKITDGISLPWFLSQKTLLTTFYAQHSHRLYSIPQPLHNPLSIRGIAKGHLLAAKRWPFTLQKTAFRNAICRLSGFIRKPVGWLLKVIPFMSGCKSCWR